MWRRLVHSIQLKSDRLNELPDAELKSQSLQLRYRALSGESLDNLMPEAFALVAAASQRVHGLRVYDVQMLGAIALQANAIAVMETGEGKTFTALFPIYLNALLGRGTHLITANDYLAVRDARWAGPIFSLLGMSVGAVESQSDPDQRRRAYRADVTYATAKEVGFDFLRDQLRAAADGGHSTVRTDTYVLRELHFALVDEADNILIDEARTPLVVSGRPAASPSERAALYRWAAKQVSLFHSPEDVELDYVRRVARLTSAGRRKVRGLLLSPDAAHATRLAIYEHIERALQTHAFYEKDRHYVVRHGEIVIVDEGTGRLADGRKWRDGLHQAIEAKEGLVITEEGCDAAKITIQALFRQYEKLAGMTGTVASSSQELKNVYGLSVCQIPTHVPSRRIAWPEKVFGDETRKWQAIVSEVGELHELGRPVLVGTRSIQKSELVSKLLNAAGIAHQVLNARHLEREAEIIARGGCQGQVTVATNMAGRGTDIRLDKSAKLAGGLHVICSELHESARIDRQLIGRCARQGDPGTYRFFHSLDDDILVQGLSVAQMARLRRHSHRAPAQLSRLSKWFRIAQRHVERRHTQTRETLLHHERYRHELFHELNLPSHL